MDKPIAIVLGGTMPHVHLIELLKQRNEFNIPSSPFILTKDMDSVNWNLVSFPCVVKPVDCNGSKGVYRAESIEEARHYVEEAIHLSQTGEAIIEEFCFGDEIQVDCVALETPFSEEAISQLTVGDVVGISGYIYCGRDAVLPRICNELEDGTWSRRGIDLKGGVIFHTAVSPAGVGPTSSNKLEIEGSFEVLSSKGGIKMHLGKGAIKPETVKMLAENNAVFAIIPPVTALLESQTLECECVAWPELGMEALYRIKVKNYQAIIAAAKGESIY